MPVLYQKAWARHSFVYSMMCCDVRWLLISSAAGSSAAVVHLPNFSCHACHLQALTIQNNGSSAQCSHCYKQYMQQICNVFVKLVFCTRKHAVYSACGVVQGQARQTPLRALPQALLPCGAQLMAVPMRLCCACSRTLAAVTRSLKLSSEPRTRTTPSGM